MHRRSYAALALLATAGCAAGASPSAPPSTSAERFAGGWRSVTPSREFIRLSLDSKSSERDALAARLTFSGVAWEGSGRIAGDSLVADMRVTGTPTPVGTIVARPSAGGALELRIRSDAGAPLALTLRRED